MTSVPFTTDDGEVTLDDVEIELADGSAQVTGTVSAAAWAHIVDRDLFGSASRSPDGVLVADPTPVRLWLSGTEASLTQGTAPAASDFAITRAERRLEGAPDGGEVWVGVTYGAADDWADAVDMLAELGFTPEGGSGPVRTFSSGDGTSVVLSVDGQARLATVVISAPIDGGVPEAGEVETLRLLNGFNRGFPAGSLSLDGDRLRVSEAFPVLDGTPVAETLEALAGGLVGLTQMVVEVMPPVAAGTVTASDALARFFG